MGSAIDFPRSICGIVVNHTLYQIAGGTIRLPLTEHSTEHSNLGAPFKIT